MKRTLTLLLLVVATLQSLFAQTNCCDAIPLFGPGPPPVGCGQPGPCPNTDNLPCGCIEGETQSTWYWFSCETSGTFEMLIKADSLAADYDFALFEGSCPCNGLTLTPALACNADASATGPPPPFELTGIATKPDVTFNVFQTTGFAPTVELTAGTNYYLMVDNVTGNGTGHTFEFAGTAGLGGPILPPGPEIIGPDTLCPGSSGIFSAFIFGGVQYTTWTIAYTGIEFITNNQFIELDFPDAPGTYFVCATSTLAGTSCHPTETTCVPVTVAPIPVSFVQDVLCFGGAPYLDGNGQAYFSPGTYTVHYTTDAGCDSTVILTLTGRPTNFIVLSEINCAGDCAEFDGETICESGTYQQVYANQFGCDSTVIFNFVAFPTESVITGIDTLSCIKTSITLSGANSIGGTGLTFKWLFNGNIVGTSPTLNVTQGGTYTLVTSSNVGGDICTAEESVFIPTNTTPPQGVTAMGGMLNCNIPSITLMGSSTTPNVTYFWTGPGGFQSFQQNPTVNQPGNYQLKVTGTNGCTTTVTAQVTGNSEVPVATATASGAINCLNPTATLTGNSNLTPSGFSWIGPGGAPFFGQTIVVNIPGNYTLTVTAPNGCTDDFPLTVNGNTTPPTANAGPAFTLNCQIDEVVLNGTGSSAGPSFSYQWGTNDGNISAGANTLTPTANEAGTYLLTVTNTSNGCTSTSSVQVSQTPDVTAFISAQTNVACFGTSTGTATVATGGGNGNYAYQWSNSQNTPTATGLVSGSYNVTVTDGENCTATTTVSINQPPLLELTATATAQTGVGFNNGTATANPAGGSPGYSYLWNTGATNQILTGLAPGNYSVVVTDANGCTAVQSVTVSAFECVVKVNLDSDDVSCNGESDGSASIELESAEPPFSFIWSNGEATAFIENLAAGNYTVTATDANGCEVVTSVTILEPAVLSANATATAETSAGANDGTATADPTGGTGTYTFLWENGEITQTIGGLAPGEYDVSVTDENGCVSVQTVTVFSFGCQILPSIASVNASCNGGADGQATVTLLGGQAPFAYLWSNDETTPTVTGLTAGTYTVSVSDDGGCEIVATVAITEPTALNATIAQQTNAGCGVDDGTATVEASGGLPDYNYLWPSGGTSNTETGLAPGIYEVNITDANECETSIIVTIGSEDVVPPTALAQGATVELGPNGTATITASEIDNGSFDDCGIAQIFVTPNSFNCTEQGEIEVTLTVIDLAGNTSTATANVTVVDIIPPTVDLQNIAVSLDAQGNANLTPDMFVATSFDNCGEVTFNIEPASFGCDDLGEQTVTFTATDLAGNVFSQDVTVTIEDDQAPTLVCPSNISAPYCDAVVDYSLTFGDNCTPGIEPSLTTGLPSGSTFPAGTTTVGYELTDGNNNTAICSFTVTVTATMSVNSVTTNVTCFGENDGTIEVTVTGGNAPYTFVWSPPIQPGLPPGTYNLTVTDEDGCTEASSYTITEPALLLPLLVSIQNETNSEMNGSIDVTVQGGTAPYSIEWTDEAGNVIATTEDVTDLAAGTYELLVTDANGCVSLSAFTIQSDTPTDEIALENFILLYPNPTSGQAILEIKGLPAAEGQASISDLVGHTFETLHFSGDGKHPIDLMDRPQGVYLVKIVVDDVVMTKRLVLQR